jgi:hypothetical protein
VHVVTAAAAAAAARVAPTESNELQKAWVNRLEAPKDVVEAGLKDFNNKLDNLLAGEHHLEGGERGLVYA